MLCTRVNVSKNTVSPPKILWRDLFVKTSRQTLPRLHRSAFERLPRSGSRSCTWYSQFRHRQSPCTRNGHRRRSFFDGRRRSRVCVFIPDRRAFIRIKMCACVYCARRVFKRGRLFYCFGNTSGNRRRSWTRSFTLLPEREKKKKPPQNRRKR